MKKQITALYIIESTLLSVPIFMIVSNLIFLLFANRPPNPVWFSVLLYLIIPIYIFLIITSMSLLKRFLYKRKQLYEFDNTLYLTLSTIISLVLIIKEGYFEFVFIYFLFPYTIILLIVLILGPAILFFLPYKKIKTWVGLLFVFLYSIFTTLVFMGIISALAGGSV